MRLTEKINFLNGDPIPSSDQFVVLDTRGQIVHLASTSGREEGSFWLIQKGAVRFNLVLSSFQSVKLRVKVLQSEGVNIFDIAVNRRRSGEPQCFTGDEDFSEGVYDITEFLQPGDNQIIITSPHMALDEISVEIEEESFEEVNDSFLISNPTGLVLNVYHKASKESETENLVEQLYPKEEFTAEHSGFYIFKTVNTKKIVDSLDCAPESLTGYQIKYRNSDTNFGNEIAVKNDSNMVVSLEKIDFSGNFKHAAILSPGERYQGASFLNEPHILRDNHSGAVVDFFYARYAGQNRNNFMGTELDNLSKAKATTVKFINCEDKEIRLLNKIENGWREIVKVGIGQVYEQQTHSGQVWEFAIPQVGNYINTYYFIPSADEFQSVFIIDKKKGVEISFKNQTHFTLKAYKKIGNQRYFFGYIAPQSTLTRYAYKNSEWEFAAMAGEEETSVIHRQLITDKGTYEIAGNLTHASTGKEEARRTVNISNQSSVAIKIQSHLTDVSSTDFGEIMSNGAMAFVVAVGAVLDIRDVHDSTKIDQIIVPPGEGTFNYAFVIKSLHGNNPSTLIVNNHTNLVLEQIWLDYHGKEVKYNDVQAGGTSHMNTYLTHPWLIKESRSGRIVKRVYGQNQNEVIDIFEQAFLSAAQPAEVAINFRNTLPFAVDLYQVVSNREEELIGVVQKGNSVAMNNTTAAPVRIREHASQEIIDTYIPSVEATQQFEVKPRAVLVATDAEVEIFNLSFFDIDVYTFDNNGQKTKMNTVDTRMSTKLINAKVGQSFFLQEKKSAKVVGYFSATEKPIKYRFTGNELRSATASGTSSTVMVHNNSVYSGTLFLVDYEGNKISKGILNGNSVLQLTDALPGNVYVFIEHDSEIVLEQIILGEQIGGAIEIQPNPISKTKRTVDELWPGEVALFTAENYQGAAYIFHADLYTFLDKINDKVRSIKLGPGTALTAFEHTNFTGINDVYHLDMPDLSETDVKLTLSSFQISYVVPESTGGISAISRLTEEPIEEADTNINQMNHRSVYRTTITFPVTVAAVDIYTTEASTFEVRGKKYTTDPVKCAKITLGANKQLVITTEANTMEQAIFMLRANTMEANERFFVFQDTDLYKKILNLEQGSFAKNRDKLGAESTLSDSELDGVQSALQNLAATMPAVHAHKTHGSKRDLFAVADNMKYDSWGLNFGEHGTQARFRPLSPEDLLTATRQGDDTVIRRNLDNEVGQGFFNSMLGGIKGVAVSAVKLATNVVGSTVDVASGVASAMGSGVSNVAGTVADGVSSAASTVAGGIGTVVNDVVDTAQTAASTGVNIAGTIVQVADQAIAKGVDLVSDASNVVVSGATKVGGFVVEGASTVADAVSAVPSVIKDVAVTAATGIASASATVLKVTLDLGSSIVEFTLDTVDKVKSCIEMIAKKVFSAVKGVIDFFKDLFAWGDIIDTKHMIAGFLNGIFDKIINEALPSLESKVDGIFKYLEDNVMGSLDNLINKFSSEFKDQDEEPNFFDEAKDKISWFFDKVFGSGEEEPESGSNQTKVPNTTHHNENVASDPTVLSVLEELKEKLADIIQENGKTALNAFLDGIESITKAITGNGNPLKRILVGVLSLVKSVAAIGFGVLKGLSTIVFKLIKLVFVFLKDLLNATIKIPFVSKLYKSLTGNELSTIDLLALVCAAPTTIFCKLIYGKSPRALQSPSAQSTIDESSRAPRGLGLSSSIVSIVYGSFSLIFALVDPIASVVTYSKEGSLNVQSTNKLTNFGSVSTLDKIKSAISTMLLLFPIATYVLSQVSRNKNNEGAAADVLGWVLFGLTVFSVFANGLPIMVSLIPFNPLADIIEDFGKGLITILAAITIPVYVIFQVVSVKGESRDNDLLKIAAGISIVANLLEVGKIKSLKKLEPTTATVIFASVLGVQTILTAGAGVTAIVGQGVSIADS